MGDIISLTWSRGNATVKYQAVIFDLFGTLVDNWALQDFKAMIKDLALALHVSTDDVENVWRENGDGFNIGIHGGVEGVMKHMCRVLARSVEATRIADASHRWREFSRRTLSPRPDALRMLEELKGKDHKIGLISDTAAAVPSVWPETPFAPLVDTAVFSCDVGFGKPDPRIYQTAWERLGVKPSKCLYVGDGLSNELTGAEAVGMDVVQIYVPYPDEWRDANAEKWTGSRISALAEVLSLV